MAQRRGRQRAAETARIEWGWTEGFILKMFGIEADFEFPGGRLHSVDGHAEARGRACRYACFRG